MTDIAQKSDSVKPAPADGPFIFGTWYPIETAPKDGTIILVSDGKLIQLCAIDSVKERKEITGRWFWKKETTTPAYFAWIYPLACNGKYAIMNMRADHGFEPACWTPLPEPPS